MKKFTYNSTYQIIIFQYLYFLSSSSLKTQSSICYSKEHFIKNSRKKTNKSNKNIYI